MNFLDNNTIFSGSTVEKARKIQKFGLLDYNWQMYLLAALIGFDRNKQAKKDSDEPKMTITGDQLAKHLDDLAFVYQIYMLNSTQDAEIKIQKAFFAHPDFEDNEKATKERNEFFKHVYGGINYLYENIIKDNVLVDDVDILDNMLALLEQIQ